MGAHGQRQIYPSYVISCVSIQTDERPMIAPCLCGRVMLTCPLCRAMFRRGIAPVLGRIAWEAKSGNEALEFNRTAG
jgi:hypothetical protein